LWVGLGFSDGVGPLLVGGDGVAMACDRNLVVSGSWEGEAVGLVYICF